MTKVLTFKRFLLHNIVSFVLRFPLHLDSLYPQIVRFVHLYPFSSALKSEFCVDEALELNFLFPPPSLGKKESRVALGTRMPRFSFPACAEERLARSAGDEVNLDPELF